MRRLGITTGVFAVAAMLAAAIPSAQETVTGAWTLTIEHFPMKLALTEKDGNVTGTLDYPHGAPFKLAGSFVNGKLTFFSAADSNENFSMHIDVRGSLKDDGSLDGTLNAHYIERDEAGKVLRTRDQVMTWTATRAAKS